MANYPVKQDTVLIGKEAVARGTAAASMALDQPFLEGGFNPPIDVNLAEIRSNATHPNPTNQVPVGNTVGEASFTPDLHSNTLRDMVLLGTKHTAGLLQTVTIGTKRSGAGDRLHLGCGVSKLTLSYASGATPDQGNLLKADMSFVCMGEQTTTGLAAGTKATGNYFHIGQLVATLNSVVASKVLEFSYTIENTWRLLRPNSSHQRLTIIETARSESFEIRALFETLAWETLARAGTEFASSFVHGTGTASETYTQTVTTGKLSTHRLVETEDVYDVSITLKPYGSSAVAHTFGSAIGASVLSL